MLVAPPSAATPFDGEDRRANRRQWQQQQEQHMQPSSMPPPVIAPEGQRLPPQQQQPPQPATSPPPNSADAALLPLWWLIFLPLYWFPQNIGANLVQTYIIPFQVEAIVGSAHKNTAYSVMMVFKQIGSCFAPVWGALSDKLVTKEGRQRRRPMLVVGLVLWAIDTALLGLSKTYLALLVTYAFYPATATISGAPYCVVYPNLPKRQRGKVVAFERMWNFLVRLIANGLAVLIGQHLMSRKAAYVMAVIMLPLSMPFGLIGLGEKPGCWSQEPMAGNAPFGAKICDMLMFRRSLSGLWTQEPLATRKSDDGPTVALRTPATSGQARQVSAWDSARQLLSDFLSATKYPPFRWLFISGLCNSTYSTVQNLYFVYWFQDEVGIQGYTLNMLVWTFHCTSAVTALAFLSTIDVVVGAICTVPGGLLADYFAERRTDVMMCGTLLTVFQPLVNAFLPTFGWVCVSNIIADVISGLTSPSSAALLSDCVPTDRRTGLAINPARDYLMMGYASKVPEILIPIVLALAFLAFENKATAYKAFFVVSAVVHLCSAFMFLKVGHELRKAQTRRDRWQAGERSKDEDEPTSNADLARRGARAPVGARLCDAILFKRETAVSLLPSGSTAIN
jgi:MFS family permease